MIYNRSAKFHRTETSAEMAPKRNLYWFYTCLTSILLVVALLPIIGKADFHNIALSFYPATNTGQNRGFDRCIVDWTNQCKSRLPLVTKSAFLQTATAAHISGPIYEAFFCSGSLKPGSFGYLWQTALALIGPI